MSEDNSSPASPDEWLANRTLIIAAPDMLAALKAITKQTTPTQGMSRDELLDALASISDIADAAIAKATVADTEEQVLGSSRASEGEGFALPRSIDA